MRSQPKTHKAVLLPSQLQRMRHPQDSIKKMDFLSLSLLSAWWLRSMMQFMVQPWTCGQTFHSGMGGSKKQYLCPVSPCACTDKAHLYPAEINFDFFMGWESATQSGTPHPAETQLLRKQFWWCDYGTRSIASPAPNGLIRCSGHRRPREQRRKRFSAGISDFCFKRLYSGVEWVPEHWPATASSWLFCLVL